MKLFLMGDAASCAKKRKKVPQGYYNLEVMLKNVIRNNSEVGVCGTCMEVRGITDQELMEGASHVRLRHLQI